MFSFVLAVVFIDKRSLMSEKPRSHSSLKRVACITLVLVLRIALPLQRRVYSLEVISLDVQVADIKKMYTDRMSLASILNLHGHWDHSKRDFSSPYHWPELGSWDHTS